MTIFDISRFFAIQSGTVATPSEETGSSAGGSLDTPQRATVIGEPVPIVFGRYRNNAGGVFISPGATEARFQNNSSNAVTAFYHLVLSEGEIDSIPVKDVFQRSCRVGSHSQTYNRRAGRWTPGNFIVQRDGYDKPECPYYCGSIGTYPRMSTLSFQVTIPDGFDQWNRQVHVFIRGGMHVTRIYDDTVGPSDNFADLVKWMLLNNGRVPASLVDTDALSIAATFLEVNGLTCNCWLTESQNYADLLAKWAPYFLLCESNNAGKRGLRPLLPTNSDGTLVTDAVQWEYVFDEDTVLPGTLELSYAKLPERLPFVVQVTWRQELGNDAPIIRTSEVRVTGTAENGPYESHDLSEFCTTEDHAVKVGTYILAKRLNSTHIIRFTARPQTHNRIISVGSIIRVKLARQATAASSSHHDYLYQVERITKTLAGDVSYECSHFPVDEEGKSLIALAVSSAQGDGVLLTSNRSGVSCDDGNRFNDLTIPDETWIIPDDSFDPSLDDWPTDGNGDYYPWPTDGNGDPLPFDPNNPAFDPWDPDNNGIPSIDLDENGIPEIPLDFEGFPIDSSTSTSVDGNSLVELPANLGNGFGESGLLDALGNGPDENSDNVDDDLDGTTPAGPAPIGLPTCANAAPSESVAWYVQDPGGSPTLVSETDCYTPLPADAGKELVKCITGPDGIERCSDPQPIGTSDLPSTGLPAGYQAQVIYLVPSVQCIDGICTDVYASQNGPIIADSFAYNTLAEIASSSTEGCQANFGCYDGRCGISGYCWVQTQAYLVFVLGAQVGTIVATSTFGGSYKRYLSYEAI